MLRKLGISGLVLASLALCAEIGLRAAGYDPLRATGLAGDGFGGLFVRASADPRRRYELTPGARGRGFDCDVSINSHGFRDREYEREKPAGTRRIVVLGDSITFGTSLAAEETYPERLEALLAARGQAIEVLNLGVAGYDTLQEAAFFESTGLALGPDLVLVGYCFNDAGTQSVELGSLERLERFRSWIYASRLAQWIALRYDRFQLARESYDLNEEQVFRERHHREIADLSEDQPLLQAMDELRLRLATHRHLIPRHNPLPWYASPAHVGKLRYAFETLAEIAGRRDVPVLVVILPYLRDGALRRELDVAYDLIAREARRAGLGVLQLRDTVRVVGASTLQITDDDPTHYNALGHERIAARLLQHLEETGFVAAPEGGGEDVEGDR